MRWEYLILEYAYGDVYINPSEKFIEEIDWITSTFSQIEIWEPRNDKELQKEFQKRKIRPPTTSRQRLKIAINRSYTSEVIWMIVQELGKLGWEIIHVSASLSAMGTGEIWMKRQIAD
jgi:hypothetical protein